MNTLQLTRSELEHINGGDDSTLLVGIVAAALIGAWPIALVGIAVLVYDNQQAYQRGINDGYNAFNALF